VTTLRRIEIAFWILGLSLLGFACATTFDRWNYQAQQERALEERGPAVSVTEEVEKQPAAVASKRPPLVARLEIPRLGVKAIVNDGIDDRTLARAVGRVPGSARPGQAGNMVLAGHRDTFFRPLRSIRTNDRIRLVVPGDVYEYRVQSVSVVEPEQTNVLESIGVEELTLVTCYPFRFVGSAPDRFIVSAVRVN
jgi:sortase A